ncbi:MAG: hypothetical protein RBJ76_19035 [Stenomitos frigidus ULC029]
MLAAQSQASTDRRGGTPGILLTLGQVNLPTDQRWLAVALKRKVV